MKAGDLKIQRWPDNFKDSKIFKSGSPTWTDMR